MFVPAAHSPQLRKGTRSVPWSRGAAVTMSRSNRRGLETLPEAGSVHTRGPGSKSRNHEEGTLYMCVGCGVLTRVCVPVASQQDPSGRPGGVFRVTCSPTWTRAGRARTGSGRSEPCARRLARPGRRKPENGPRCWCRVPGVCPHGFIWDTWVQCAAHCSAATTYMCTHSTCMAHSIRDGRASESAEKRVAHEYPCVNRVRARSVCAYTMRHEPAHVYASAMPGGEFHTTDMYVNAPSVRAGRRCPSPGDGCAPGSVHVTRM